MAKIIIYLGKPEHAALEQLAQREMRLPRAQAAQIIRQELIRQGLLAERPEGQETKMAHALPVGVQSIALLQDDAAAGGLHD